MDASTFVRSLLDAPEPQPEPSFDQIGQSARDHVAAFLMGQQRPTPERRKFVHGLLGSAGYGHDQPGVVDIIPRLGSAFGLDDAVREGNAKSAAMHALGLVPKFWPTALMKGDEYKSHYPGDQFLIGLSPNVPITLIQSLLHSEVQGAKKSEGQK